MLERLREIALDAGLDPDEALGMTVVDFMRAVAERRAARMGLECTCNQGKFGSQWCPVHRPKPIHEDGRSEWLRNVEKHCNNAKRSSLATMSALGKSGSKVRKVVSP